MTILNSFKPVSIWSAEKVRRFFEEMNLRNYNLVDVRTPKEFEQGHLPDAQLIPIGEMADRFSELDPNKPTIVY